MLQTISTILTVLIAVGAIWAAFASTRQAQYSRRLAGAAERNVGEQIRSCQGQNERARLSFEVDMLFKLEDRINSQRLENTRRRTAKYLKDNSFTSDGGMQEVQHVHPDSVRILTFFEEVGNLRRVGVLRDESVWYMFRRQAGGPTRARCTDGTGVQLSDACDRGYPGTPLDETLVGQS